MCMQAAKIDVNIDPSAASKLSYGKLYSAVAAKVMSPGVQYHLQRYVYVASIVAVCIICHGSNCTFWRDYVL